MAGYLGNIPTPQATQTRDTFTATASQTSFATSGYTVGMLDVYLNGIKLASADFTATNGSDVVLASGASADDIVEVVSFSTFESDSGTFTGAVTVGGDLTVDTSTLKVDSSNNRVGIGTASPSALTTIKTASNEEDAILIEQSDGTDVGSLRINGGAFILKGKSATAPIQIQTVDGNEDIEVDPDGFIKFETAGSERMRINSDGRVDYRTNAAAGVYGVSITATDSQSDIGVAGSGTSTQHRIKFFNTNGQVGAINTSGSATSYNTSSDYRLKENVTTSWDATSRLKQLKPSRFNFKTDKDTIVDGFLAHEVSSVVPEAITGTKDEVDKDGNPIMQSIDQSKLVPLLVKAIQELSAKNDTLEAQVADLITRVKALEDK